MTFWEELTKICAEKNISPSKLCKEVGLSNATATHWKQGATPTASSLYKICLYLKISPKDFHYNTTKPMLPLVTEGKSIIYDNIITLCIKNRITLEKLISDNILTEEMLISIKNKNTKIDTKIINNLSRYFKVSTNEIIMGVLYDEYETYMMKAHKEYKMLKAYEEAPDYIKQSIKKLLDIEK